MAYCLVSDVEREMQLTIARNGRPGIAQVEQTITDISAELDGILQASGYTVPVTSAAALPLMKRYTTMCVCADVWHSAFYGDQVPAKAEYWGQQCEGFKMRMRKGEQQLPGLSPESDLDPAFSVVTFPERDGYWTTRRSGEDDDA